MRKALRPFAKLDRAIVRQISRWPSGPTDAAMRELSSAATKGKLWFAIAGVGALFPGKPRRAALSGVLALGLASATTNLVFKTLLPRRRPAADLLPVFRFVNPQPVSSSLPSGHSASAFAFATGVATTSPAMGLALAPLALGVAYSRIHTGAHWPSDVVIGSAIGVASGFLVRNWFPAHTGTPQRRVTGAPAKPLPDGAGLRLVANSGSGSYSAAAMASLRRGLPAVELTEFDGAAPLSEVIAASLREPGAEALGVWGGDGTVGALAQRALREDLPLAVFPGGTFNHFARDIQAVDPAQVQEAVRSGSAISTDVAEVLIERSDGKLSRIMLNTASVGIYPELVQRRELLQKTLGKPIAGIIAGLRTFAVAHPTKLMIDGRRKKIWLVYLGRGRYYPRGFAPLERPILDDGVLDVRVVSAHSAFSRFRLLSAILTGRTEVSKAIDLRTPTSIRLDAVERPFDLAIDGEVIAGVKSAVFTVLPRALTVFSAARAGNGSESEIPED